MFILWYKLNFTAKSKEGHRKAFVCSCVLLGKQQQQQQWMKSMLKMIGNEFRNKTGYVIFPLYIQAVM